MTEKEILDFINHLEESYEVDKWEICGIHVWPLVRLNIGDYLLMYGDDACLKDEGKFIKCLTIIKRVMTEIIKFLKLYFCDYWNNAKYSNEQILCIINNEARRIKIKKHGWINQTVSPIYDELVKASRQVFCLEFNYNRGDVMFPRANKSKIINFGLLLSLIKHKMFGNVSGYECLPDIDDVIQECRNKGIDRKVFDVQQRVQRLLAMQQYYLELLKVSKIRLIIISNWRNTIEMALVMAGKKLGIRCIEINHGFYGQNCYTHFGWIKEPKESYEVRPDYYWCWTKEGTSKMNKELKHGKAIYGGAPQALAWGRGLKERIDNIDENFGAIIPSAKKVIIFTLTDYIKFDEYPVWLLDVIKETSRTCFWLLRKHNGGSPDDGQEVICKMCDQYENVEWEYSSVAPLFQLLEYADVHVTYDSSTVIEAEAMGIRSIVLSKQMIGRFDEQVKRGYVDYAGSKEEMIGLLEHYISCSKSCLSPENGINELIELLPD